MSEQSMARVDAGLRALLADPAPVHTSPWQVTARTIRIGIAVADAVQLVALGAGTRAFFPGAAAAVDGAAALGFGAVAAVMAVAIRRACRGGAPDLGRPGAEAARAATAAALSILVVAALWWFATPRGAGTPDLAGWLGTWVLASAAAAAALRLASVRLVALFAASQRLVVVGGAEQAEALAKALTEAPRPGRQVIGRIDDREIDGLERLARMIERRGADTVALAMSGPDMAGRVAAVCDVIADQQVRVLLALDAAAMPYLPRARTRVGRYVLFDLLADPHGELGGAVKRTMDLVLGGLAVLLLSPVLAAAALAVRLESPGPVLFRQWRFGCGSRPILVFKFRSMRVDACDATGERRTTARDPRVTRIGRILRRTSLDELPQLLNVLRGDMSLVGPRPHPLHMRVGGDYYFEVVDRYRVRHAVKPGITGWAQVNGARGEVDTVAKARRRLELDLWYIENWSLALDLRILLRTALGGFASPGAD